MKNNTRVRLHLSKQLFESLAQQVIAEAKGDMSGGAYTEAVKAPKEKKEKKSPEMKATKKMKEEGVEEMETRVAEAPKKKTGDVEMAFQKHGPTLLKALKMRTRNKEDIDAHDAVKASLQAIAKHLGLDPRAPYMEDETFSGAVAPLKALNYAKEMFTSELEDSLGEMETKVAEAPKKKTEEAHDSEEKVTITLNEFTGSPEMLELGQWIADNYPTIAKAISSSAAEDPDQRLVDLGMQVLQLATVGTVGIAAGLAVAKDDIIKAAKKVKSLLGGKKAAMSEADDTELAHILAKVPDDLKGKV